MTDFFGQEKPWIVAGPCSAESREQVLSIAGSLSEAGVKTFRAGLWKPRTRPGHFEGVGEKGLEWLVEVRDSLGMKVCTEAASAFHVEQCLKAGLDAIWIGARTTTNPFLVQEISDALEGTDIFVFVKNPINADLQLWVGAVERLMSRGVENIGLVHRGFSSFEKIRYRNSPQWHIPAEMKRLYPALPFLCDPSHLGGDASVVEEISRKAIGLGFDGLMVEVHCNPSCALSDASQQLSPDVFRNLLHSLKVPASVSCDETFLKDISESRNRIDAIDNSLLELLCRRMTVSREIGRLKKKNNVAILQPARWDDVINSALEYSREYDLDPEFIKSLFNIIHAASIAEQNKVLENVSQDQS